MSIKTEYKGHDIYFNENSEEWVCRGLDDLTGHKSLSSVKRRIDDLIRSEKATNVIDVINLEYNTPSRTYGKANEFIGLRRGNLCVAVVMKKPHDKRATRNIREIKDVALDTVENRKAIEDAYAELKKASHHKAEAERIIKAIPRLSEEMARTLTEVSE